MAASGDSRGRMTIHSGDGERRGSMGRTVLVLLLLCVVVWLTLFIALRTDGGRSFVEERVARRLGMPVKIDSTRLAFPLTLVMEDLSTTNAAPPGAGFKVEEVRVAPRWNGGMRLVLRLPVLRLQRQASAVWEPKVFSRLGTLPERNIAEVSYLTAPLRRKRTLHVIDGTVQWYSESGDTLASASGIDLRMRPVALPGRTAFGYTLSVYDLQGVGHTPVTEIRREWLATEARPYIEIHRSDRPGRGAGGFWEPGDGVQAVAEGERP